MAKRKMKTEAIDEDLPSNSNVQKSAPIRESRIEIEEDGALIEEPVRAKKVVRGQVIRKKRTLTQSIAEALVGEESQGVISYIINDVLIPAAKSTIQDVITNGIEMVLYGESKGGRSRSRDREQTRVSYGSYFKSRDRDDDRRERRPVYRDRFGLGDIFFKDHSDAEEVLDELCSRLEEYDQVTVADYFELADIPGASWAHTKYGWENLKKAYNTHTRHGWAIVLPEPIELE